MIFLQTSRNLQQHRLAEALDRPATLLKPAHDRRRRQCPDGDVRKCRCRLLDKRRNASQSRNALMLEHRARRDDEPRLAGPAHQLDRHDAVAPEREEVVVDADPLHPQHLGKQPAQHVLLRRARPAPHAHRHIRRRKRLAVELAVGGQRQPLQHHKCRRHHVVGKAATQMRPQRRGVRSLIGRRNHIGHQPLAARHVLARHHRRLRHAPVPHQRRLDLARLNAEPAHLHLAVGTPQKVQNPIRTPARQVPGPIHPAPRRTKRIRHKPLPRQARTTQIAPRQPRTRNVKLPRNPGRHRLQSTVQDINPRVPDRSTNRRHGGAGQSFTHGRADCRLRRTISVEHPPAF
jgi:hypothetical protein